jgi:hypothetical protein
MGSIPLTRWARSLTIAASRQWKCLWPTPRQKAATFWWGASESETAAISFPLTVFADVPDDARAMRDEPFGPLALINPVGSLDEAIEKANAWACGSRNSSSISCHQCQAITSL